MLIAYVDTMSEAPFKSIVNFVNHIVYADFLLLPVRYLPVKSISSSKHWLRMRRLVALPIRSLFLWLVKINK